MSPSAALNAVFLACGRDDRIAFFGHTWQALIAGVVMLTSTLCYAAPEPSSGVLSNINVLAGQPRFGHSDNVATTPSPPEQTSPTITKEQGLGTDAGKGCPSTVVTNGGDFIPGSDDYIPGSLRQILRDACPGSTITFAPGVNTVALYDGALVVRSNMTIDGGAGVTVMFSPGSSRDNVISIDSGITASMNNLTITNGETKDFGGGIQNRGNLILTDVTISDNFAYAGGGIYNTGSLTMTRCTVSNNIAGGGAGIENAGSLTVTDSTISNNTTTGSGGPVIFGGSGGGLRTSNVASLTNCTIAGNVADYGGGIEVVGGTMNATNCTISYNRATGGGGGIRGLFVTITLTNTVVAQNLFLEASPDDVATSIDAATSFNNLIASGGGGLIDGVNGNLVDVANPQLAPLGNYGGPTQTVALLPGSPAVNAGTNSGAPATDQRGVARPQEGTVDMGAYESRVEAGLSITLSDSPDPVLTGNDLSYTVTVANAGPYAASDAQWSTTLPAALGFQSLSAPGGWSCTTPAIGASGAIHCSRASLPVGNNTFTLVTRVALATPGGTILSLAASVGSTTTDPVPGNNAATATTTVETAPTLSINDVSIVEGNSGTQSLVFTVTRTGVTTLPASFTATITDGTATAPSDYSTTLTGSTTIAAGGNTGTTTLTVAINGDSDIEGNEDFLVKLTAPVNATITDGQGVGTITNDDDLPTYSPAATITRQQGSPASAATLGTISDPTDPAGSLLVAVIPGGTATGVSATDLTNANGSVTVSLAAACTAVSGTLRLQVTDSGGLTDTNEVQIDVTPNTAPTLNYSTLNVGVGDSATQNPNTGPSDNGNVTSISVLSAGTYAGTINVSNAGVISFSNATPAGTHAVTIRATDNCGAETDVTLQIVVAQATTIKQLTSNVNPARFAQSVSLSAQVTGVDPSGSVAFFNDNTSLGTAPLTVSGGGNTNQKVATLTLASLPVGNLNLTAHYPGDTNNLASTSPVLVQSVIATDTRVTVSAPGNPINQGSNLFNVSVQAVAPGAGVPQGSVRLSAGSAQCVAPLAAGVGSCSLNLSSPGFTGIIGNYASNTGNHNASTSGLGVVVVPTPSSTDLRVRIGNGTGIITAGAQLRYDVVVDNIGSQAAVGRLEVPLSVDFASASYSCESVGAASCGAVGSGSVDTEVSVSPGGAVIYSLWVTAPLNPERTITQSAGIRAKTPTTDPDLSNNDASDVDPMGLLADGFEEPAIEERAEH